MPPQATEKMRLGPLFGKPVLVVPDLRLVKVTLDEDADLLTC